MAELLTDRCLPFIARGEQAFDGLVEVVSPNGRDYADPATAFLLQFDQEADGRRTCTISDVLRPTLANAEGDVMTAVGNFAHNHLSDLNDAPLLLHDLSSEFAGTLLVWRVPDTRPSYYAMFTVFPAQAEPGWTTVTVGVAQFQDALGAEETT